MMLLILIGLAFVASVLLKHYVPRFAGRSWMLVMAGAFAAVILLFFLAIFVATLLR